jgi:hypothetical protein
MGAISSLLSWGWDIIRRPYSICVLVAVLFGAALVVGGVRIANAADAAFERATVQTAASAP